MRKHPVAWIVATLIVLILAGFFLIPLLLSTTWGTRRVEALIQRRIPGKLHITSLHLSWIGSQQVRGIELLTPGGDTVFQAESLAVGASLWRLFWGSSDLKQVHLAQPYLFLSFNEEGQSNLRQALGVLHRRVSPYVSTAGLAKSPYYRFYTGTYTLSKGTVVTQLPDCDPVTFQTVNFSISIPKNLGDCSLLMSSKTFQGGHEGHLHIQADHFELDPSNRLFSLWPTPSSSIELNLNQVPVAGLDALLSALHPHLVGTLTKLLGPSLQAEATASMAQGVEMTAQSTHLQAEVKGLIGAGELQLQAPAHLRLTITPEVMDGIFPLLPRGKNIHLLKPTQLTLEIPNLEAKWRDGRLQDIRGNGHLNLDRSALIHPFTGPFAIGEFVVKATSGGKNEQTHAQGVLMLEQGGFKGQIDASCSVHNFLESDALTTWTIQSDRFPTPLFEPFVHRQGLLPDLFGPTLTLNIEVKERRGEGSLSGFAKGERVEVSPFRFKLGSTIELEEPAELRLNLNPTAWDRLTQPFLPIRLQQPTEIALAITDLSLPRFRPWIPSQIHLNGAFSAPRAFFSGLSEQGTLTIHDLRALLKGNHLDQSELEGVVEVFFPDESGRLAQAIGDLLPLSLQAQMEIDPSWSIHFPRLLLWIQSRLVSTNVEASLPSLHELHLLSPIEIHYTLTPEFAQALAPSLLSSSPLLDPIQLQLQIEPWSFDLTQFSLWQAKLSGQLTASNMTFSGADKPKLEDLVTHFVLNDPPNTFRTDFRGHTPASNGTLKGTLTLSDFLQGNRLDIQQASLITQLSASGLPTALLGLLTGQGSLDRLVGPVANIQLQAEVKTLNSPQGQANLFFDSSHLTFGVDLALRDGLFLNHPLQPAYLQWTITPEGWKTLLNRLGCPGSTALAKPTQLMGQITALNWPYQGDLAEGQQLLQLNAHVNPVQVLTGKNQTLDIHNTTLTATVSGPERALQLKVAGDTSDMPASAPLQGSFSLDTRIAPIWPLVSQKNLKAFDMSAQVNRVGTRHLLPLLSMPAVQSKSLSLLLGDLLSASFNLNLQDDKMALACTLEASRAAASVRGIIRDGTLRLTEPLTGSAQIDPELGSRLLRTFNPLLVSSLRSQERATLEISPQGFSLPLRPLNLLQTSIEAGTLTLGHLWIANEGSVSLLLALFPKSHASQQSEIRAWMTPIYFKTAQGVLTLQRSDLLLDRSLQIANWGTLSAVNNRVALTLAIPGYCLRKVLNEGNLADDNYLLLPVRGTLQDASIDYAQAAVAITAMIAKAKGKAVGTIPGLALDMLSGAARNKGAVPQPTTQPFPWALEVQWPPYRPQESQD